MKLTNATFAQSSFKTVKDSARALGKSASVAGPSSPQYGR